MNLWASLSVAIASSLLGSGVGGSNASSTSPHQRVPFIAGRPIEAARFDEGRSRSGDSIRTSIQTGTHQDTEAVHPAAGDWLAYTLRAPSSGAYVFSATVACPSTGAQFHCSFDGVDLTGSLDVPKTNDGFEWNTVTSHPFRLSAGDHVMRLHFDRNAADCDTVGNFGALFVTPVRPGVALTWRPAALAPAARFEGVGRVVRGKLYTFGGYTSVVPYGVSNRASVYDPASSAWTDLGVMPIPQTHCAVAVDESRGCVIFAGGRRGAYPGRATSEVWQYDIAANAWTPLPPLPEQVSAASAELLNGQFHCFGGNHGQDRATDYDTHFVLDLNQAKWHTAAPLPFARDHISTAVLGGKIYVFGGEIGHDAHHRQQTSSAAYDPATDSWMAVAAMPIGKSHAESSTFALNGRIIVAGGQVDNFLATANIVEYDPATDTWDLLPPLPQPLEGAVVQPLGDRLFITGGYIGQNSVASVASYVSNPFTGLPNSSASIASSLVIPLGLATVISLGGALAIVKVRRRRTLA